MTGYLQRLLDATLPASGPPALTPVVKSTSPIFEQNQLLGLTDLSAGEGEPEAALPPAAEAPSAYAASAPPPLPPTAAGPGVAIAEMTPFASQAAPWPDPSPGRPSSVDPLPPRPEAPEASAPALPESSVTVIEAAWPDLETSGPAPRRESEPLAQREPAWEASPAPDPFEPVLAPVEAGRVAGEAAPPIGPEAGFRSEPEVGLAAPHAAVPDLPRPVEPVAHADPPFLPRELEPRPRPEFDDGDPEPHQSPPTSLEAPPSITIGRITIELVPDPAPVAKPAGTPRTAATASTIGPLGNRRARRRLFALSRL